MRCRNCSASSSRPRTAAEAQQARTLNTIVYRLYVRPPAQSPYVFSGDSIAGAGREAERRDRRMAFGPDGSLFVTSKTGVLVLSRKGATLRSMSAIDPRAIFVDARDGVLAAQKALLHAGGCARCR